MAYDDKAGQSGRQQSRDAILAAALEVFGAKSFAGSTTAAVAERAGVSKGLVFNYFPTKDALLQALVEKMLTEALDFWDARPWQGSAREQLRSWIDTAIAQVQRRPGFYRLYFSLALQPGGSAPVDKAVANLTGRLEQYLARAEALLQEIGSANPALDARLLQCAINGLAQAIVTGPTVTEPGGLLAVQPLRTRLAEIFLQNHFEGELK